jgi:hypothetical protein
VEIAQIDEGLQQQQRVAEARLLGRGNGLADDLAKVHVRALGQQETDPLYTRATGHCSALWTTAGGNGESWLERFRPGMSH